MMAKISLELTTYTYECIRELSSLYLTTNGVDFRSTIVDMFLDKFEEEEVFVAHYGEKVVCMMWRCDSSTVVCFKFFLHALDIMTEIVSYHGLIKSRNPVFDLNARPEQMVVVTDD